ncbi:MAG: DUF4249 domain-containing protein [Bacteroides sp.]|nr:DUF4249 domain-containing protein [Bacteroides sp.]
MNKKIYLLSTLTLVLSSLTTSCEDIIDVELRNVDPILVIEGNVRMGEVAEVRLTKSKNFSDLNDYPPIQDAIVVIEDNAGNREQLTYASESGKYRATTITGVERRAYNLSVTYEGIEYTATSTMPPRVEIDSLTLWKFPFSDFYDPMVHFKDPEGEENQYYRYVISINGEYPKLQESMLSTEFMDGNDIHDPIFVRLEDSDDDDDDPIQNGDLLGIEMRCLDEGTFDFYSTLSDIQNALANPTSNIKGGALGYFAAYSYTYKEIVSEWEE